MPSPAARRTEATLLLLTLGALVSYRFPWCSRFHYCCRRHCSPARWPFCDWWSQIQHFRRYYCCRHSCPPLPSLSASLEQLVRPPTDPTRSRYRHLRRNRFRLRNHCRRNCPLQEIIWNVLDRWQISVVGLRFYLDRTIRHRGHCRHFSAGLSRFATCTTAVARWRFVGCWPPGLGTLGSFPFPMRSRADICSRRKERL